MRHAELLGQLSPRRVEVNSDDHVDTGQARALDHIEPDAAQPKHHNFGTNLDFGGEQHHTNVGGDATADVTDLM